MEGFLFVLMVNIISSSSCAFLRLMFLQLLQCDVGNSFHDVYENHNFRKPVS